MVSSYDQINRSCPEPSVGAGGGGGRGYSLEFSVGVSWYPVSDLGLVSHAVEEVIRVP